MNARSPVEVVRGGGVLHVPVELRIVLADHHETIRLREGQRLEEHRVDRRKDRRVGADGDRERHDCRAGERRVTAQSARRMPQVVERFLDPARAATIAVRLAQLVDAAERDACASPRFIGRHAERDVLFRLALDVERHFVVQFGVGLPAAQEIAQPVSQGVEHGLVLRWFRESIRPRQRTGATSRSLRRARAVPWR